MGDRPNSDADTIPDLSARDTRAGDQRDERRAGATDDASDLFDRSNTNLSDDDE